MAHSAIFCRILGLPYFIYGGTSNYNKSHLKLIQKKAYAFCFSKKVIHGRKSKFLIQKSSEKGDLLFFGFISLTHLGSPFGVDRFSRVRLHLLPNSPACSIHIQRRSELRQFYLKNLLKKILIYGEKQEKAVKIAFSCFLTKLQAKLDEKSLWDWFRAVCGRCHPRHRRDYIQGRALILCNALR